MSDAIERSISTTPTFWAWARQPVGGVVGLWLGAWALLAMAGQPDLYGPVIYVLVAVVYPVLLARTIVASRERDRGEAGPRLGAFPLIWIAMTAGLSVLGVIVGALSTALIASLVLSSDGPLAVEGDLAASILFFGPMVLAFPAMGYLAGAYFARHQILRFDVGADDERAWRRAHRWGGALMAMLMLVALIARAGIAANVAPFVPLDAVSIAFCTLPHAFLTWRVYRRSSYGRSLVRVFE